MSARAQTMDSGRQAASAAADVFEPVAKVAQGIWWAGLGLIVLVGDQGTKLVSAAIKRGKEFEPNLTEPIKKAGAGVETQLKHVSDSVSASASQVEEIVDRRISKTLSAAAKPIQSQLSTLGQRLDELDAKLNKLGQSPRRTRTKKKS